MTKEVFFAAGDDSHEAKRKIVHFCGVDGECFLIWTVLRLKEMNISVMVVDCSSGKYLSRKMQRIALAQNVISSDEWELKLKNFGTVLMYHETKDRFIDSYKGLYLMFSAHRQLGYVSDVLSGLTYGRMRIFEHTLVPQLILGKNIYVLVLKHGRVCNEYFVPAVYMDEVSSPYTDELLEIFTKNILMYIKY